MLLQKLVEYSARLEEIAPPGYSKKPVRYLIELDSAGKLRNPHPIDLSDKENKRGKSFAVPHTVRSSGVKPLLLADNAEYTLGLTRDGSKPEQVKQRHDAYVALVAECAEKTDDNAVTAILHFLQGAAATELIIADDFDPKETILFRVDAELPTNRQTVQNFWNARTAPSGDTMQCLICGQQRITLQILNGKINGIPGGQAGGLAMISANKDAFGSYGLQQSQVAPVCEDCADRFTKSLNHLLGDRRTRMIFNNLAFTFWTREHVADFDLFTAMDNPTTDSIHNLLAATYSGKWQPGVDDVAFYAVALSASGARAVVRDWIDTTVGNVKQSLARWFRWQQIVDAWGAQANPLGIYRLAAASVREMKDLPIQTPHALLHTALYGTPLPSNLLQQALRRNAVEHTVTYSRAALIKLILASQSIIEENAMVQLQTERTEAAYHCGRLLAVLEQIQQAALGRNVNTTIVDRFYGTASTAPATVFGTLLGQAQPHLSKLRRSNRENAAYALQSRLEEVLLRLPNFPRTLTLQDQALFALGYYHQRAHDHAQAAAHANAKKNANPANATTANS